MTNHFAIKKIKRGFVTNNSVVIEKGKVLKESCVTEFCFNKYKKFSFRLKYCFTLFSNPFKEKIIITDEWSKNYCHWLWEALSKLVVLKDELPKANIILPKSYLKIDFMTKSLEAFGYNKKRLRLIPKKSQIRVKNLSFIPCINISTPGYYDFLKFVEVADTINSYYKDEFKTNFGERIYISRSNPKTDTARRVENEEELTKMLAKNGFKTVYMEEFSFLDQISIMHFAKYIVAPHGAGITNVMFAKKDCHLFELVNKNWAKTCFEKMCDRMPINYHRFDSEEVKSNKNMELRNIVVDVKNLEESLIKILP